MQLINPMMKQKTASIISKPWFFPILICICVNGIGIWLTSHTELSPAEIRLLSVSYSKHNAIMSVVGTSLMTLIGVTFSISMLILSTLSNQYGPRLLPNILHSRITQVTLGFFLATFLFTLFCLYFDSSTYTRAIQSIYILVLAIICIFVLILFVNYVINSIQIDYILEVVQANTKKAIKTSYFLDEEAKFPETDKHKLPKPSRLICIKKSGYVQGIDYQMIKKLACDYNCLVELKVRPGDFVITENHIISVFNLGNKDIAESLDKQFRSSIRVGQNRVLIQDIEIGYEQISEIAVRALSPGINDPYTARHCLWVLADLFVFVEQYQIEAHNLYDDAKWVGWYRGLSYEGLVHAALDRIRQASKDDVTVMLASFDMISKLITLLKKRQLIRPLMKQAKAISEMLSSLHWTGRDKSAIDKRLETLKNIAQQHDLDW